MFARLAQALSSKDKRNVGGPRLGPMLPLAYTTGYIQPRRADAGIYAHTDEF